MLGVCDEHYKIGTDDVEMFELVVTSQDGNRPEMKLAPFQILHDGEEQIRECTGEDVCMLYSVQY